MIVIMITTIILMIISDFDNYLQQSCELKMKLQKISKLSKKREVTKLKYGVEEI